MYAIPNNIRRKNLIISLLFNDKADFDFLQLLN